MTWKRKPSHLGSCSQPSPWGGRDERADERKAGHSPLYSMRHGNGPRQRSGALGAITPLGAPTQGRPRPSLMGFFLSEAPRRCSDEPSSSSASTLTKRE